MDFSEIRFVMNDGTEIVIGRAYIREFAMTQHWGGITEVDIRIMVPDGIWRTTPSDGRWSVADPDKIEAPAPRLINGPGIET